MLSNFGKYALKRFNIYHQYRLHLTMECTLDCKYWYCMRCFL